MARVQAVRADRARADGAIRRVDLNEPDMPDIGVEGEFVARLDPVAASLKEAVKAGPEDPHRVLGIVVEKDSRLVERGW